MCGVKKIKSFLLLFAFLVFTGGTAWGQTVTSVSPNTGSTLGGETVTINGTGFSNDGTNQEYRIFFGGVDATGENRTSSTTITCTTPAHAAGVVDVVVEYWTRPWMGAWSRQWTRTLSNGFTYETPSVTLTSPNGGEVWNPGNNAVTWSSTGLSTSTRMGIDYSTDGGNNWISVDNNEQNDGSFTWNVPNTPSTNCRVRVYVYSNPTVNDISNNDFTITGFAVTSPNGGENWQTGKPHDITWTNIGYTIANVQIHYSTDGGSNWTQIVASTPAAPGVYSWIPPKTFTSLNCLIRVRDASDSNPTDQSDMVFLIYTMDLTAPNGGEDLQAGSTYPVTWTHINFGTINLDYSSDGGSNWIRFASNVNAGGSGGTRNWTLPPITSDNCLVRIASTNDYPNRFDISDAVFSISQPSITVTYPNGGETLTGGTPYNITWTSKWFTNVRIRYSTNGGTNWTTIVASTPGAAGSYPWTPPVVNSNNCLIEVSDTDGNPYDRSDAIFSLTSLPPTATTQSVGTVTGNSAVLQGVANAQGSSTTVTFEWGLTTSYGNTVPGVPSPITGSTDQNITANISGLTPLTTYHYRITATSAAGTATGLDQSFTTLGIAPGVVTNAASPTGVTAVLNGSVNPNNSGDVTAISFDYGLTTAYGSNIAATPSTLPNGTAAQPVTGSVSGLARGTLYHYRVQATNGLGTTLGNDLTFATQPNAPTAASATGITASSFTAAWDSADAVTSAYLIDVADNIGFAPMIINNQNVGKVLTYLVNSGIGGNTTYHYRIRSNNAAGSSESSNVISVLTLPNTPTDLASSGNTTASFDVAWVCVNGADNYSIDVSPNAAFTPGTFDTFNSTTLSLNVTGRAAGTQYWVRVRATNGTGTTINSAVLTVWTVPPRPTADNASAIGEDRFTANWYATTGASEYLLDVSDNSGFSSFLPGYHDRSVTAPTINDLVTGLSGGTLYYYRLRASNSGGISEYSVYREALTIPNAPALQSANDKTTTSFTANWNSSLGYVTGYAIDVSTVSNFATFITGYNNKVLPQTAVSEPVGSLNAGTTYYYRVRASNSSGTSSNPAPVRVSTIPNAPTALGADNIQPTQFRANWNGSTGATKYFLDVATDDAFTSFVSGYENRNVGSVTLFTVSGLESCTIYYYRVRADNSSVDGGTSVSSGTITAQTAPPPAPTANAALNESATSFRANWSAASGAEAYLLDVSRSNTFATHEPGYPYNVGNVTSYDVINLDQLQTYYYRVASVKNTCTSGYSNTRSATTAFSLLWPPNNTQTSNLQDFQFTASWNNTGGLFVTPSGYRLFLATSSDFAPASIVRVDTVTPQTTTSYTMPGRIPNIPMYWRVQSFNGTFGGVFWIFTGGESDYSTTQTLAASATNITGTNGVGTLVETSWPDGSHRTTDLSEVLFGDNLYISAPYVANISGVSVAVNVPVNFYILKAADAISGNFGVAAPVASVIQYNSTPPDHIAPGAVKEITSVPALTAPMPSGYYTQGDYYLCWWVDPTGTIFEGGATNDNKYALTTFPIHLQEYSFHITSPTLSKISTPPKRTIEVPIEVGNLNGIELENMDMILCYDPAILKFMGINKQSGLLNGWKLNFSAEENYIRFYAEGEKLTKSGVLVKILFEVIGNPGDESELKIRRFMANSNIPVKAANGNVKVVEETLTRILEEKGVPSQYNLEQNYPNPFNPKTIINYSLVNDAEVSLRVYDALGREVTELEKGRSKAGYHEVVFNASNCTSGVYYYVLRVSNKDGDKVMTKKMLLLK